MRTIMILVILLIILMSSLADAQVRGDYNCNGVVNGLDITFLIRLVRGELLDSSTCTWQNGDLDGDSINHTIGDWCRWPVPVDSIPNPEPQPFDLDTISVGNTDGIPGHRISLPVTLALAQPALGVALQFHFDTTYIYDPRLMDALYYQYLDIITHDGNIYWQNWPEQNPDTLPAGSHRLVYLLLNLRSNIPPDTILNIELVGGDYYPSGIANASFPTYFISPILVNGEIHITANPACVYIPGDANGNGVFNATDVVFMVNYLKGTGQQPPDICDCAPHGFIYAAADANGSCAFNGVDITYCVNYLRGIYPSLQYCADCPPARR